ncbi:unnamed protein product [Chondrus crispus]|uniref:R3H domain-containing protein n=1 Tax=Chondrus crispus TaxID=2769 RepID=R7QRI7_CHOCR|nr:unnamed protein product [Chondrus crispus]CDF41102.1 unnamed protein product [Chondrus crispus]|eukprot:XP_005711396.1 unnamed protein product [Chondrus crispus]
MSSVSQARGRLPTLTAAEVEALASQLPLRPLAMGRRLEPAAPRRSRRTAAHQASERAPVVSRRMRRIHNEALLALSAAQQEALAGSSAGETRELFEMSWRSAWETLGESKEQRKAWGRFVEMDEGAQREVMEGGKRERRGPPGVDGRLRELAKSREGLVRSIVDRVEEQVVGLPPGGSVVVRMEDAVGRLVVHGVAEFHRLAHRSIGTGRDRVTVIRKDWRGGEGRGGRRLMDVLA